MKIFKRIILIVAVISFTYTANSQCFIKANASPTTICAGQGVFLKSFGSCSYLMNNNFNNQTLGVGWQSTAANPVFTNPCGPGPNAWHAWVGTTASSTRTLETINYDVSIGGCKVDFWMRYGRVQGSGNCEDPDAQNEGVHLQYSTNNGASWTDFPGPNLEPVGLLSTTGPFATTLPGSGGYWTPYSSQAAQAASSIYYWNKYSCPVPAIATTTNTKFRWAQLATSSTGFDAWGIDEVEIVCPDSNAVVEWRDQAGNLVSTQLIAGTIYPTTSQWYYVFIIDTISNFSAKDSVYITVNPIPTPDFTASDTSLCQGGDVLFTYVGNADTTATYNWDFDGIAEGGQGPKTKYYSQYGVFPVSLNVNAKGCQSTTKTVNIHVNPKPLASFYADVFSGCDPLTVNFINATFPTNSSFLWNFGDGDTSTQLNPTHTYTTPGTYTVNLAAMTSDGCSDSISIPNLIKVFANPVADFMADRYITSFKDPSFSITNLSTYPDFCAWDFGDGTTDVNCNIGTHIFPGEGDYNICLVVTSIDGCKDSICKPFRVIVDEINIPNVITPNGDGANETFVIENVSKLMEHNLMIYNRWGKKVFESTNYQNDWDADNLSDGVYYYIFNYKTMLGIEERVQGTVTVMRKGN